MRTARFLATLLVAAGLPLLASAPAQAAACTRGTGVTVVVDGHQLGGLSTTCVTGAGRTAAAAFNAAGVSMDRASRSPGFVCRVNGAPGNAGCVNASPATAYWSLWVSDGKGSWSYASRGVDSLNVPTGGWVAWSWQGQQARSAPGVTPSGPAAPSKRPVQKGSDGSKGSASSGTGSGSAGGSSTGGGRADGSSTGGGSAGQARGGAAGSDGEASGGDTAEDDASGPDDASGEDTKDSADGKGADEATEPGEVSAGSDTDTSAAEQAQVEAARRDEGGGAGPWVAGLAVLGVLVAAGVTAWRRRAASH